jgi:putative ABC transport system permease protein
MQKNYYYFLLKNAIEDFKRNKTRTFLTSLGLLIGVLSVVMLISLGLGLKNYIKGQFESLGTNLIMILPGSGFGGGGFGAGIIGGAEFDEKDVRSLERIAALEHVVPVFMKTGEIQSDDESEFGYIYGTSDEMFELMKYEVLEGRLFTKADGQRKSKNVVLGNTLADKFYDLPEEGVGKTIRVNNQRFYVIGVLKKKGDPDTDGATFIPYQTTYGTINPDKTFFAIYAGVPDESQATKVKDEIKDVLLKRYEEDDFTVSEQAEILGTINQIFSVLNAVLIAIGSISLIVGGIGIMNIMYATVTERTKEIGIRRAIGATKKDILMQFLSESVILSLFGGTCGLAIAVVIVLIVKPYFPLGINTLAVGIAFGVSSLIGVFFGVFPARRAANLTPIDAIRYE